MGSTRSKEAGSPAAITARLPAAAPRTPPLTGESTVATPRAASSRPISSTVSAPVVDSSTQVPNPAPAARPRWPKATSRTTAGAGRAVGAISARSGPPGAGGGEGAPRLLGARPGAGVDVGHDHRVAGREEAAHHGQAHVPQPDEPQRGLHPARLVPSAPGRAR